MRRLLMIIWCTLWPAAAVVWAASTPENNSTSSLPADQQIGVINTTGTQPTQEPNRRMWNLRDVDIRTVTEQVARETGKSFIIDPAVNGKATIVSNKQLSPDELYQVYLSVLQVLGFSAVPAGDIIKIVPDANAKYLALPFAGTDQPGDSLVVSVIPVGHVGVAALVPVLRNLVSQQGHLAAYAPSNVIIVADRESNVARLTEVIERIDREEFDGAEVVVLEHATASEVVESLNTVIASNRGNAAGPVALAADDRSNVVIISGDKSQRLKVRSLIAQLDVPRDELGNTEVVYLQYQRAEELVPVLSNILSSYFSTSGGATANSTTASVSRATPNRSLAASTTSTSSTGGASTFTGFQTPERQATGTVIGSYGVQAEPNMNALIITAPPSLMRNLRAVISQLDVRRAQVMIEAVVAEVSADRNNEFGIEWRGGGALAGGVGWDNGNGLLNQYQNSLNGNNDSLAQGDLPGSGLTVGIIHNGSLRFLLHALSSDSSSNVLATPSIVAMDNAEARISVGDAVAFETGSYATTDTTATVTPFNTIEYREVGLELIIKPQLSQGDLIQLDIMQRVDNILTDTNDQPTTSNRMISTRVMVNNNDILVLGGLIQSTETEVIQKVPVLGDIPIIGQAFRNTTKETRKTNLMIFIRPSIMRDMLEANQITKNKYNFIRDEQILSSLEGNPNLAESRFMPWEQDKPEGLPLPQPFN